MKRWLAIIVAVVALSGCAQRSAKVADYLPEVEVATPALYLDTVNLGRLSEGQTVSYRFAVRNSTNTPLAVLGCYTGCGCITADFPRKPIKAGERGVVEFQYHTAGQRGLRYHVVDVTFSTGAKYNVMFGAVVE